MASSKAPSDWRAGFKDSNADTSSGKQLACTHKAVPTAHVTFVIDCATGKQVSLSASTVPPQASRANEGCVTPLMKTFVLFCGKSTLPGTQDISFSRKPLDGAKDTLPPYRGLGAPDSLPASLPGPQDDPIAKGSSLKAGATEKHSTREKVKHSLKTLSCLCRSQLRHDAKHLLRVLSAATATTPTAAPATTPVAAAAVLPWFS